ncbi:hypothetical protein V6N13_128042 [Hibiscus sabdariffa]|uniref:Uncharacterized protein n=1 Tax=Hibiscus sabdariffa TaxID=183260 RepID=A0ABR2CEW1_9ROSI
MKKKSNAVVYWLLLMAASIVLSMPDSGSLLAEARIPNFSAIQGCLFVEARISNFSAIQESLKSGMQRRNLKPLPPAHGKSPDPSKPPRHLPPAGFN